MKNLDLDQYCNQSPNVGMYRLQVCGAWDSNYYNALYF